MNNDVSKKQTPSVAYGISITCGVLSLVLSAFALIAYLSLQRSNQNHGGTMEILLMHVFIGGPVFCVGIIASAFSTHHRLRCAVLNLSFAVALAAYPIIDRGTYVPGEDINADIQRRRLSGQ